jgi:hypothetical protein
MRAISAGTFGLGGQEERQGAMSGRRAAERRGAQECAVVLTRQLADLSMLRQACLSGADDADALPTDTRAFGKRDSATCPVRLGEGMGPFMRGLHVVLSGVMGEPSTTEKARLYEAKNEKNEGKEAHERAMQGREALVALVEGTAEGTVVKKVPETIRDIETLPRLCVVGSEVGYRKIQGMVESFENRVLCAEELRMREHFYLKSWFGKEGWTAYGPTAGQVIRTFKHEECLHVSRGYDEETERERPHARFGRLLTDRVMVKQLFDRLVKTKKALDVAFVSVRWLAAWMQEERSQTKSSEDFMADALEHFRSAEAGGLLELAAALRSGTEVENSVLGGEAERRGTEHSTEVRAARTDFVKRIRSCEQRAKVMRESCEWDFEKRLELANTLVEQYEEVRKADKARRRATMIANDEKRKREGEEAMRRAREEARRVREEEEGRVRGTGGA